MYLFLYQYYVYNSIMEKNANAKLNLTLEILGKAADGYHYIKSIFQEISLHDIITVEKHKADEIIFDSNVPIRNSTIEKALEIFRLKTKIRDPLRIYIKKNIPIGGGLGGGSTDATNFILIVNELFGNPIKENDIISICENVGKDAPFFVFGGTSLVEGKGEKIKKITGKKCIFIIISPPFHISTKRAYLIFDKFGSISSGKRTDVFIEKSQSSELSCTEINELFCNDFENVYRIYDKRFRDLFEFIKTKTTLQFHLTGSGSCVFRAFESLDEANIVNNTLKKEGIKTFLCNSIIR